MAGSVERRGGKPNVLFILTDDQRYDTINALGNKEIFTPNMNYLVENGTSFVNAHIMGGSHPAVCMPSRAMIHTGRDAFSIERCGYAISPEHATLGETLSLAGYNTIGIGKWHNGTDAYVRSFTDGDEILFAGMEDHWNVPLCHFNPSGKYPPAKAFKTRLHLNREKEVVDRSYDHVYEGRHSSEIFADAAVSMIRKYADDEKPMFLYMATMAPHDPRTMPKKYMDMYDPDELSLPENYLPEHPFDKGDMKLRDEYLAPFPRTPDSVRRELRSYYAMITHLDAQIGRVLDALRETGQLENTLIIFAGDNGLAIGSHGLMGKQNLYEHSIRVPFIICGPGVEKGAVCAQNVFLNSIFATVCEFAGVSVPQSAQFPSVAPFARGEKRPSNDDALFFLYTNYARAVKDGYYKLIEYLVDGRRMTQLFDLEIDPWEMNNLYLSPEFAPTVKRLRGIMLDRQKSYRDPMTGMFGDYERPAPVAGRVTREKKAPAVVCHAIFDYSLDDAPIPEVAPGGVLARVEAACVTPNDVMAYRGSPRYWGNGDPAAFAIPPYVPLGEFVSRVEEDYAGIAKGSRVLVESVVPCGKCDRCLSGESRLCQEQHTLGFMTGFDGGAARYAAIPAAAVVLPVPESLSSPAALLAYDAAQAALCLDRADIRKSDSVILTADGPLGLAIVSLASRIKPAHMIVISRDEGYLRAARALGADCVINPSRTTILRDKRMLLLDGEFDLFRFMGSRGCDVFINASEDSRNVQLGLELLGISGRYMECGVFGGWTQEDWSTVADRKQLTVMGVKRSCGDLKRGISLIAENDALVKAVDMTRYGLDKWRSAFDEPLSPTEKRALCPED